MVFEVVDKKSRYKSILPRFFDQSCEGIVLFTYMLVCPKRIETRTKPTETCHGYFLFSYDFSIFYRRTPQSVKMPCHPCCGGSLQTGTTVVAIIEIVRHNIQDNNDIESTILRSGWML
jgi:hypothetical protein